MVGNVETIKRTIMKLNKILLIIVLMTEIVSCDVANKEDGITRIYLTGGLNGLAEISPDDVTIDKENKTMTFAFGICRSGLQPAKGYIVDIVVDNTQVPGGTAPLAEGEYILKTTDGNLDKEIRIPDGEVGRNIYLTIPEEVFTQNYGKKLAIHISISNPSLYELNPELSNMDIVIDVVNFLGAYEDVTNQFLKNTSTPFEVTLDSPPLGSCDPYQHTPTEWIVNDAVKIHPYEGKMFGGVDARCWGNRNWLSAGNFDYANEREILNGKIFQTVEIAPGKYRIEYEIGEAAGGVGHAALVVAQGTTLPDFNNKENTYWQEFTAATPMDFDIQETGPVSIGFIYNIPKGVQGAYAIKFIKLKRQINVFND